MKLKLSKIWLQISAMTIALTLCSATLRAQSDTTENLPENAYHNTYGDGWECERGFKKVRDRCAPIKVPENASLNAYGRDWACDRGYLKENETCIKIRKIGL